MSRSETAKNGSHVMESALCGRIAYLVKRHSLSEIARKTATLPSSVHQYLGGTRVPAKFCMALTDAFGVNPAWLMTGEGAPYLADVPKAAGDAATNLLDVVSAMKAVVKLRLGAVSGKTQQKALRDLNENLDDYEQLRSRLNAQSLPYFRTLLDDLSAAIASGEIEHAKEVRRVASQVSRFCDDEDLTIRFALWQANLESHLGNIGRSLEFQREAFGRRIVRAATIDNAWLLDASNYVMSLFSARRWHEARRVVRAMLSLAEGAQSHAEYLTLMFMSGVLDAYMGDIKAALPVVSGASSGMNAEAKDYFHNHYMRVMLLAGTIDFAQAMAIDRSMKELSASSREHHTQAMLVWACWLEDADALEQALRLYAPTAKRHGESPMANFMTTVVQAKCLMRILRDRDSTAVNEYEKQFLQDRLASSLESDRAFAFHMYTCRMLRLLSVSDGRAAQGTSTHKEFRDRALRELLAADESLAQWMTLHPLNIFSTATHYRNALALIEAGSRAKHLRALRVRAEAFYTDYLARGYSCLRVFHPPIPSSS